MKLVADRVMVDAAEAFGDFGELSLVDGRRLAPSDLADCDVLLVRSVTRVNQALLADSPVCFVGTATAGTDHIDLDYLAGRGIAFAAAPGCNARAVGEYVLACVLALHPAQALDGLRCGIIGLGHAGSAAARLLAAAGVSCIACDPPRAAVEGEQGFVTLAAALDADIVSLHVPLRDDGPWPTRHLLGAPELGRMRPGALLINAARGGVVDETALHTALTAGRLRAVLDCWMNEPAVAPALLARAEVATPHIAGHAREARARGTWQLRDALAVYLARVQPAALAGYPPAPTLELGGQRGWAAVRAAVRHCVDPLAQSAIFRAETARHGSAVFDRLRAQFGERREFAAQPVALPQGDPDTARLLQRFDFPVLTI